MRKAPSKKSVLDGYGDDPKKVKDAPKDYKELAKEDGKTYYKKDVSLSPAAKSSNTKGGADYEKFLQEKLASGVTPEQLVKAKYIAPTALEKYKQYYKPNIVYTEEQQLQNAIPQTSSIPLNLGANIDRKLITTGNNNYATYEYPDVNAGYSKPTTKHFDLKTNQEIDPLKSYGDKGYNPFYLSNQTPSAGTTKSNVPMVTNEPIPTDSLSGKPVLSAGFKHGGKIKGYYNGTPPTGVVPQYNLATQGQGTPIQTTNDYQAAQDAAMARKQAEYEAKQAKRNAQIQGAAKVAGNSLLAYSNQVYQPATDYTLSEKERSNDAALTNTIDTTAASVTPWYGLAKGLSNMGRKQLKTDKYGNVEDGQQRAYDEWMKPQHEHIIDSAKREGVGGVAKEILLGSSNMRAVSNLLGKGDKTKGFWGFTNKFSGETAKRKKANESAAIQQQAERDAENAGIAEEMKLTNKNRLASAIMARDMGDTEYDAGVYEGKKLKEFGDIEQPYNIEKGYSGLSKEDRFNQVRTSMENSNRNESVNSGGGVLGRGLRKLGILKRAEGGEITGAGTAKSDSIKAKVKEGSFIVPAENAHIAKELKEKVLRKAPNKKANLNQGGGVDVMLSNGEYAFSPEERRELEAEGIDLTKLAPNAKDDLINHLKCGGKIKGYAKGTPGSGVVDPKKELAKLKAQNQKDIAERNKAQKEAADLKRAEKKRLSKESDIRRAKAEYERLSDGISQLNKQYEDLLVKEKDPSKRAFGESPERIKDQKIKLLEKMSRLEDDANAARSSYDPSFNADSNVDTSVKQYTKDDFNFENDYGLAKPSAKDNTITKDEFDAAAKDVDAEIAAKAAAKRTAPKKGSEAAKQAAMKDVVAYDPTSYSEGPESVPASSNESLGQATSAAAPNTPLPTTPSGQLDASATPTDKKGINVNWAGLADNLVGYGLPIAQTAIGLKKLRELGKRPVDKLDPAYQSAITQTQRDVERARQQAKYGFTGEEKALMNAENTGITNTGRAFARNIAGGNAAQGLGVERAVLNDAFGRKLQSRISDNALKLQKQDQAAARQMQLNDMLAHNQELNRRLFSDAMSAWNTDQVSAGQLVNAGLSNAIDNMRFNKFKKQYEEANQKYQF